MKLLIDQKRDVDAAEILLDRRTDHLLFVPDNNLSPANPHGNQRLQIAMQERPAANLDEAFRVMLGHFPQTFSDSRCQNDRLHTDLQTCSKASRNPPNCASDSAPILATRKILFSKLPCPA